MSSRPGATLGVFRGAEELGALERRGPSRYRFAYSESSLARHGAGAVVLSASLPVRAEPFAPAGAAPFFEGLLPEGAVRAAIARSFRLSEEDGFGLLEALGAECAGAVAVLAPGVRPVVLGEASRELDGARLAHLVEELPRNPLGVDASNEAVRLSLGGIQHKLVLSGRARAAEIEAGAEPTGFRQPLGGAPSTCLLKPEFGAYEDLVANEAFCLLSAAGVGLDTAHAEPLVVAGTPCLYVQRFDRVSGADGRVVRVHQEDMCQALGVLPSAKYEENGGPTVAAIVALLRRLRGPTMARDVNDFIHAVLVNFLLGNSDAHGKNFALLYGSQGVQLAPLYDVVSTVVYPEFTDRMAMSIGGVDRPGEVDIEAWGRLAEECDLGGGIRPVVRRRAAALVRSAEAHRRIARANDWHRPIIDAIVDTCRERAQRLLDS